MNTLTLKVDEIVTRENSRAEINSDALTQLMASMKHNGLLTPVGVRPIGKDLYELVFGNRRLAAARKLGWKTIDCVMVNAETDIDRDFANYIENYQRQDLSLAEYGRYCQNFIQAGLTPEQVAVRLGASKRHVKQALDAFSEIPEKYHPSIKLEATQPGDISLQTAKALINLRKQGLTERALGSLLDKVVAGKVGQKEAVKVGRRMLSGASVDAAVKQTQAYKGVFLSINLPEALVRDIEAWHNKPASQVLKQKLLEDAEIVKGLKRYGTKAETAHLSAVA